MKRYKTAFFCLAIGALFSVTVKAQSVDEAKWKEEGNFWAIAEHCGGQEFLARFKKFSKVDFLENTEFALKQVEGAYKEQRQQVAREISKLECIKMKMQLAELRQSRQERDTIAREYGKVLNKQEKARQSKL